MTVNTASFLRVLLFFTLVGVLSPSFGETCPMSHDALKTQDLKTATEAQTPPCHDNETAAEETLLVKSEQNCCDQNCTAKGCHPHTASIIHSGAAKWNLIRPVFWVTHSNIHNLIITNLYRPPITA